MPRNRRKREWVQLEWTLLHYTLTVTLYPIADALEELVLHGEDEVDPLYWEVDPFYWDLANSGNVVHRKKSQPLPGDQPNPTDSDEECLIGWKLWPIHTLERLTSCRL